jgi:hypothetical protein
VQHDRAPSVYVGGGAGCDAGAVQHDRAPAGPSGRDPGPVCGGSQRGRLQQALLAPLQPQGDEISHIL